MRNQSDNSEEDKEGEVFAKVPLCIWMAGGTGAWWRHGMEGVWSYGGRSERAGGAGSAIRGRAELQAWRPCLTITCPAVPLSTVLGRCLRPYPYYWLIVAAGLPQCTTCAVRFHRSAPILGAVLAFSLGW